MSLKKALVGLALASAFVATDAQAETFWEGLEMRIGVTAPIVDNHVKYELDSKYGDFDSGYKHTPEDVFAGISGTISFGYRWGIFGLYLDEDLGGVWYTGDTEGDNEAIFVGGTYLTFRGLLGLRHDVELDLGLGLGMMYSDDNHGALITNKDGDAAPCFAIKVGVGLTYYLIPNTVGVGINFDYSLGLNIVSDSRVNGLVGEVKGTMYHLVHYMNPGIHVVAQF